MKSIYFNGDIITYNGKYAEAVVSEDGRIIAMGKYDDIYEKGMHRIDLEGYCMVPAFIDAHSHLSGVASSLLQINLETDKSIASIQEKIKVFIEQHSGDSFVMAKGYDQNHLVEGRHPIKEELDIFDRPVIVQHVSGHHAVFNSKAFEVLKIKKSKYTDSGQINLKTGQVDEQCLVDVMQKVPMNKMDEILKSYSQAQEMYASYGITTIQEGLSVNAMIPLYEYLIDHELLYLDVVGYTDYHSQQFINTFKNYEHKYLNHFKLGGVKMMLDGSPQNKTAWMSTPYLDGTTSHGLMSDEDVAKVIKQAKENHLQVMAHCNGDLAIQQYLDVYKKNNDDQDTRPVIVHAQFMKKEQLDLVKELHMIPSYFISHAYYFGDTHINNLGLDIAKSMSPCRSTLDKDIPITIHTDAPVILPNILEAIDIAVNRKTREGVVLEGEKITVLEALKAVTIHAAYQYHEEDQKGSIEVGKNADFVVLNENIFRSKNIKDIKVLVTFKKDKVVYRNTQDLHIF